MDYERNEDGMQYYGSPDQGSSDRGSMQYTDYGFGGGGYESGDVYSGPVYGTGTGIISAQEVMAKSFLLMVVALIITAFAAYTAPAYMLRWMVKSPINIYLLFGAELAIVLVSNSVLSKNKPILAGVLYTVYSYLTGAVLGVIFLAYTGSSVAAVFLMTAGTFAVMAVYGMVTKRDLSSFSSLFMMGLVGIIIASLVNGIFLHSSGLDFIISIVGVLIFVGLTAYDTQKIKERAALAATDNVMTLSLMSAFELYLDFINLFLRLLRLFGKRK